MNLAMFEASTCKIEDEGLSYVIEDVANGENVSLHYVWFVTPMMQICHNRYSSSATEVCCPKSGIQSPKTCHVTCS
jgi:hypothetical protein